VTDKEWQARYQITSTKGKLWTRSEVIKRAVDMARLLAREQAVRPVIRTVIELVLDDEAFMRSHTGNVPARVVEDAAFEALYKLVRKEPTS